MLIEKWGHSVDNYNGKIYMFGGRNHGDFNDLIEIDPIHSKITKMQINSSSEHKIPNSRRKHSSCVIGSSLVIFGGFNNEYFSDMQFISLCDTL